MVFEGVLVDVLNHFLRPYVKNLDASQLKIAIWSGDVLLENLELKENVLDDLDLPVRVFGGYLERLKLKIPWKNLYSAPITIEVDGLYAVAGPATALEYNAERDAKETREKKEKQLKRIEEARKRAEDPKDEKVGQDPGFVEKLITQMIRNVQIIVKNIHIHYEDAVTNPSHPFSFGITLDSLLVQSTDSNYVVGGQAADPDPSALLIYKLLQLNCLAVYWKSNATLLGTSPPDNWTELLKQEIARPDGSPPDMHYVVHPITLEAKLQLTTSPGRDMDIPQALIQVSLQKVALALEKSQFHDAMGLVESFDRMSINQKFLKYRPEVGVREDVRVWWRYAITAVREEEVKRKLEMWSWKHMKQHREWCRQYTEAYVRKLLAKSITPALQKELEDLEMKLDVFNLTICRQLAESKAKQYRRVQEEHEKAEGSSGWWGWATGWMGGGGGEKEKGEEIVRIPSEEEMKEEKEKLYEAIGYSEEAQVSSLPQKYVAHKIGLHLDEVSLQLRDEEGIVANVLTSSVRVSVQNRPSGKSLSVQTLVGRLSTHGRMRKREEEEKEGEGEGPIIIASRHDEDDFLLSVFLDINPVDSAVDQRFKVLLLPVQVTYHADTVDAAVGMFILAKDVQLQKLTAAAASTLEDLKTQGRAGLEHAISQRKLLDLDITINSPCVLVPQNGVMSSSSSVIVVDFGRLDIKSDLKSTVPDVREATMEELDKAFYDHFDLKLSRLQVLVAGPGEDWRDGWSADSSPLHLLEPTGLELWLKKSLLPNDTRLPNLKVGGELPTLSLNLSDKKIKQLLQLVQSLPLPPPSLAEKGSVSSSTYSLPDQPSSLGTDSILETISETLLIPKDEEEGASSEEYETASEGELDSEGVCHHRPKSESEREEETVAVASTTNLSLQFTVNKIGIHFSEYQQSSGHDNPRLHLLVTSVTSQVLLRSWDLSVTASVGDLHIADYYATGGSGTLLSTELAEGEKFLRFSYSKFDPKAPQYTTVYQSTRQSLSASLSLLRLHLHRESLLNLLDIGRSISTVLKTKDAPGGEKKEEKALASSPSSQEAEVVPERLPGERDLHLEAKLVGVEVVVAGDDVGEVMSASVKGLETHLDMCHDHVWVHASMVDISVVDREESHFGEKIIYKVKEAKKIVSLNLTLFKPSSPRPPSDLDSCDLDLQAEIERLRITILFRFLGTVKNFATQFLNQLKLDQTTIDSAREAASQTATRTAEALKERSSSRVRLNVTVQAPLLVIPYRPSSLASPSSTPSPLPPPLGAIVANLGVLTVQNKFSLASDAAITKTSEPPLPPSSFLSPTGLPAIVDCMNVMISSVQLTRVLDLKEAGDDLSCDEHVILKPLQFQGQVTRRLSDWCKALPAISVASKIEAIQMLFSPSDYHALMSVLRDMKELDVERKDGVEEKEEAKEEEEEEEQKVEKSLASDRAPAVSTNGKKDKEGEEEAGTDGRGEGGESSSQDDTAAPDVHVEAMVGALELVLHTARLDVAEMRVNRVMATVDLFGYGVCVKAGISAVELLDCSQVLYQKIISVAEDKKAVEAEVALYSNATKGEGYLDTSKSDLAVSLRVQRIRVVALYLFVTHILNYLKQLQVPEVTVVPDKISAEKVTDVVKTPSQDSSQPEPSPQEEIQKRIKLNVSIRAPEIAVPLNSQTKDIVVLDLGQLTLENEFHLIDLGDTPGHNKALYEQYQVKLTDLEMYRSVWDSEGNKPTDCRRGLLEPVTLCLEMERNLSTHWYHGMPTLSVDAQLEPLQVVASADDIEALCKIVNGNLKESPDRGEPLEERPSQISLESTGPSKNEPTAEPKESQESVQEGKEQFTTLLASAKLRSIGIKLYNRGHALTLQETSTWVREERKELTGLVLKNFQTSVSIESNGAMSARVTMEDCLLDDLRPTTVEEEEEEEEEEDEELQPESSVDAVDVGETFREQRISRLIQRRDSPTPNPPPLISLNYNLSQDKDTIITATIDGIQMLANLKFIQILTNFILESIEPFTTGPSSGAEEEEGISLHRSASRPAHPAAEREQKEQGGPEKKVQASVKVLNPLVALLENARVMDSNALVLQTEVHVNVSLKLPSNKMSVQSFVTGLSISTARYPNLDKKISKNVLEPLPNDILAFLDKWDGSTSIVITVPSLTFILSPAAVRLILGSIQSLDLRQDNQDKVGETAPSDLWTSKPLSQRSLRRKWYFKEKVEEEKKIQADSSVHVATSSACSITESQSLGQSEYLSMKIENITVLVEQEVTTPTLRTFPALSIMMGKYGSKALTAELNNWSSQLTAHASLSLEVSYYNIRTDSWEPILEPIVHPKNENRYMSWNMHADVRMRTSATQGGGGGEEEEDEEEEEGSAALSLNVFTKSALQLTVTKTSLSIFNELWQAYTGKGVFEEVDTPETLNAAFAIVNKLGRNYPVTVKPQETLKVHGAYSPIVRQGDSPLPLHPLEGTVQMGPGELLPRDSHLRRVHIVQLQIPNFVPLNIALGMYERVYYPLTPWHSGDSDMKIGVVVDIDRTTGTPTVTLRSPLQVHNHLDESVAVYHSGIHSPPLATVTAAAHAPPDSAVPLPLEASGAGYLYFQLKTTGVSQQAASWKDNKSLDIACPLVPAEGEKSHKEDMFFIHSKLVVEEYSRTPSFPLSDRAHHILHLYHPLVIHNLLPHTIVVAEGHSFSRISSGCEASFTNVNLTSSHKFQVEVEDGRNRWTGYFSAGPKNEPEMSFKVTGPDSRKLELTVKKEEKGAWHLSVFSRYWMVNKTGLTLEYKAGESFFGQRSSDVFLQGPKTPITLFPCEEVCVRVLKDSRHTKWSDEFSLDTVGSEGIFSCHFKDSKEEFQIGTKVEMSKFGISKIITLSPFYIINNETRDDISLREYGLDNPKIHTVPAGEVLSFWPQGDTEKLTVAVADPLMTHCSAPFTFTDTRSLLVRTGSGQQLPSPLSSLQEHEVPALEIEIQVTGSANIITFIPYYLGCVPLQLVNHTDHIIHFRQNAESAQQTYPLLPRHSLMYTWDDPQALRELVWRVDKQPNKFTISPKDGSGTFQMPLDTGSAVDPEPLSPLLEGGEDEVDTGEAVEREEEEVEEEEVEEEEEGEGQGDVGEEAVAERELDEPETLEEESVREKEDEVGELPSQAKPMTEGTEDADFSLRRAFRGFTTGVGKTIKQKVVRKKKKPKKGDNKGYWISFMDGLQRVVLFTSSKELKERVEQGRGTEPPHTELSLSLIGTGLSLVDDEKGQEIAYIGIPQSEKEWQIRVKKMWKAIPPELSEKIEAAYRDPAMQGKEKKPLPETEHEVNFHRMYLYDKKGQKNKLRRSHFEGVSAQITLSEHLMTINVRISHVQVDNQLQFALNPIILYPYPPPPSIASKCAPKPFIESTIIIRKTEQSNVKQIEYLQVLIQEMGVNVDMSFLMAMLGLLAQLPSTTTEAQMVERDVNFAKLSLKESKVAAVSAAVSRSYFKHLHLSPLDIHLSFSLERSDYDEEAKKATEMNIVLTVMLNVLTSFATLFGKAKDAELRLGYFELRDVTLTQQALLDRITKHYIQQGAIQMYSIVLGLEVLGNPVGFIKGFKDGAISLFYHPIQGAVLGPEEFFEGVVLGGREFVGGTIGGISGVLGKVTGVLGDTTAKLTMDEEFLAKRRQGSGTVGQGLEGAAKGVFEGVTGLVSQPIKGAKKEGLWGLVKGTGKGVLGLVLRPTGGLIDLTSATFNAVQKKTKVGDYEVTQMRPPRFIGQPKIVYPYSPHKAEGYALFTAVDRGRLLESDVYFDHIELVENPLKVLLITNNQLMVIKYNGFLDRWDDDWQVAFKEMCEKTKTEGSTIVITVLEEQGGFGGFLSSKKKTQQTKKPLKVLTPQLAEKASTLVNQAFQEYSATQNPQQK